MSTPKLSAKLALFKAIRENDTKAVEELLSNKSLSSEDINGKLTEKEIQALDPEYRLYQAAEGHTPLLMALSLERMDIALRLLQNPFIDLTLKNAPGLNIFHMIAYVNDTYDYKENGIDRVQLTEEEGTKKIQKAVDFVKKVEKTLNRRGSMLTDMLNEPLKDERARTPLMLACEGAVLNLDLFDAFIEAGADYRDVTSPEGNLLHHIAFNDREDLFANLLKKYTEFSSQEDFVDKLMEKNEKGSSKIKAGVTPIQAWKINDHNQRLQSKNHASKAQSMLDTIGVLRFFPTDRKKINSALTKASAKSSLKP